MFLHRRSFLTLLSCSAGALALPAQSSGRPNFSGIWKKDTARSPPVRPGEVTLKIKHHDPELVVEQTVARPPAPERHATQRYTTDGTESASTAPDGDSLQNRVMWQGNTLVFTVVEHERDDNTIHHSTEVWSLSADGETLTRVRRGDKGEQTSIFTRQHQGGGSA